MYWSDGVHRLQFNDHWVLNQQVDALTHLDAVIENRKPHLRFRAEARLLEFMLKANCVSTFEQAGAEFRMNSHGGSASCMAHLLCGEFLDKCCNHKLPRLKGH